MKTRTGVILTAVALAAAMLVSPAYAGQSGSGAQGSNGEQAQSGVGSGDQTRDQTRDQAQDCLETEESSELKLRVRSELRVGENSEPSGDGRTRERERVEDTDASADTSETVEPTNTVEPTVPSDSDEADVSSMDSAEVIEKRAKIEQTGLMEWIRSVFAFIGLS